MKTTTILLAGVLGLGMSVPAMAGDLKASGDDTLKAPITGIEIQINTQALANAPMSRDEVENLASRLADELEADLRPAGVYAPGRVRTGNRLRVTIDELAPGNTTYAALRAEVIDHRGRSVRSYEFSNAARTGMEGDTGIAGVDQVGSRFSEELAEDLSERSRT